MMFWSSSRIGQRRGQEHQPRNGEQEMHHGVDVAKPLTAASGRGPNSGLSVRKICSMPRAQRMRWPICSASRSVASPAASGSLQIGGAPAVALQPQRGMRILGHRLDREAADAVQRGAPDHRAGAAEERRVPEIVAVLHQRIEHVAFARHAACRRRGSAGTGRANRNDAASAPAPCFGSCTSQPTVSCRKARVGTWSQSKIAMNSPSVWRHRVVQVAGLGVVVVRRG